MRVAVMRMDNGPVESSCASTRETSYSLYKRISMDKNNYEDA